MEAKSYRVSAGGTAEPCSACATYSVRSRQRPGIAVSARLLWQYGRESFNAARAMQYTREVVAFGARPIGSANHKKLENYILNHLKGDGVEEDAFVADTPDGQASGAQPDCEVSLARGTV